LYSQHVWHVKRSVCPVIEAPEVIIADTASFGRHRLDALPCLAADLAAAAQLGPAPHKTQKRPRLCRIARAGLFILGPVR